MAKELMNEAERFLLQHWEEARLLEESMDAARDKYKQVFQRVVEAVTEAHLELDDSIVYPTQMWSSGSIWFGRKSWRNLDSDWPPGLWMENLRIENLAAEATDPPIATIWISPKARRANFDFNAAQAEVVAAATELLSPDELDRAGKSDSSKILYRFGAPSKRELLELLADGDGEKFVGRFVAQFDMMSKFVPVLDKLFERFAGVK